MASKVCSHHKVSSAYHLPSLLFFGFLCSSINGDSMNSPNTACPSFDCGNGVSIRYPFWHQTQQVQYCGYPGFNLSCNGKNPELHYSCQVFNIKDIDYSNKSLALAYPELERQSCPKVSNHVVPLNTTPPSSFNHTAANKILHFFYNCTLYPPSLPHIACLANKAKRSYVFVEGTIPEFDWHGYCESAVSVLVNDKGTDGDLVQALLDGFKLTWHQPDGECQSCEASGGFCGYHGNGLHRNFFCFCSDGRHALDCLDKGIWQILKAQAKWLTGKVGHLESESLAHEVSESLKGIEDVKVELKKQKQDIIDAIKVEISGSLKGGMSQPQEGLDKQTQEYVKDVVNKASQSIGDQNTEILEKLSGFKEEIEKVINDQDLDERFRFTEKVIRDCIADVEKKIAKLQRLGRDILEEVSDVGGKTDVEKLVLENNRILKRFQEENLGYQQSDVANLIENIKVAGLEQLVRREDLNDLEKRIEPNTLVRRMDLKQEIILGKLEEQQKMLKDFDMEKMEILLKNANGEIEEVLKVVSKKVDMLRMDATIAEELAKAQEHLNKAAQYMPLA